jgi:HPt (histidine-containing phosphotransfer) domain-containing protein
MNETEKDAVSLIFDRGELLGRVENDCELLGDIIRIFKQDFPSRVVTLREAVKARDGKRVALAAHTLKGMFSNLAATQATATVAQLEQLGRQGDSAGFDEAFATFEDDASKLLPLLEACIAEECR